MPLVVAIDIGGTFTDLAAYDSASGTLCFSKSGTTPEALEAGALTCLGRTGLDGSQIEFLRHGTTVVINTVVERTGARTAVVTTEGFRDVLEIGRGNRPEPFNLFYQRLPPLVPREHRFEVPERVRATGEVLQPLDASVLPELVRGLTAAGIEAVAVCLLHGYRNPVHERRVGEYLRAHTPFYVTCSHEISREFREYERTSTTVINAYVGPRVASYVGRLTARLREVGVRGRLFLMGSNGGVLTEADAVQRPLLLIESGPVGGVAGAAELGALTGHPHLIAFDMGGTTAKAVLVQQGEAAVSPIYYVGGYERGYPVQAAVMDVVEVGTGGGSIAAVNEVGALEVGPRSAGAVPGPACYGAGGTAPTVTDANLFLGRLNPHGFLGGELPLRVDLAEAAVAELAAALGTEPVRMAAGIVRLAVLQMASAIRMVTVERGRDPRDFTLVAYGGAGPLHAVAIARELGIRRVLIPRHPGHFSACGMLYAALRYDLAETLARPLQSLDGEALEGHFRRLERQGEAEMRGTGITVDEIGSARYLDMRYQRQEHTIKVRLPERLDGGNVQAELTRLFEEGYRRRYGHLSRGAGIDVVNLRVVMDGRTPKPPWQKLAAGPGEPAPSRRPVFFDDAGFVECAIWQRESLPPGFRVTGPVVIEERASTVVLMPGDELEVDEWGNALIQAGG